MMENGDSDKATYDLSIVNKDHIIWAIKQIDENGIPPERCSKTYNLYYNGEIYPPKYVICLAYKEITGEALKASTPGLGTQCYKRLKALGFTVLHERIDTEGFYPNIQKFISQIDNGEKLKPENYLKEYGGLKVVVSFGKGRYARIPSISFLHEGQEIKNGIYPAFLYYSQQKILVLAYTVSEGYRPRMRWNLPQNIQTIESYFLSNGLGVPEKYGQSYAFRVYSPTSEIESSNLDEDLNKIIAIYKETMQPTIHEPSTGYNSDKPFDIHRVSFIYKTGFLFDKELLFRYITSLLTKPFVILSGLSGSGKTRLALMFAKWLSSDPEQVKVVPVGADWNNREYLLGCPNALDPGRYIQPDNGVLNFVLQAIKDPTRPYFLILDEMNLSYVERYFADFLSAMESDEPITLHPDTSEWEGCDIPSNLRLPPNLYITGTINVDETTYMFSPKVLDRANVIEFRISETDMKKFLDECRPIEPDAVNHYGAEMAGSFTRISQDKDFHNTNEFNAILLSFFTRLKQAGAEFGYRTALEIHRFIGLARKLNTGWDADRLIDIVVMQKMLPKLHGSRKKMQPILETLWKLCFRPDMDPILMDSEELEIDQRFRYPLSATKIRQMYRNARDNGFTSYAEA